MDENSKKPFLKPALIYGAIMGFVGILISVIFYVTDLLFKPWAGILSLVITIFVLVYLLRAYRNEYLNGLSTYGRLVLMSLAIGLVSGILAAVFNYLLYYVIDPDLVQRTLTFTESKLMDNPRIPENMIDKAMERAARGLEPLRLVRKALIGNTIFLGVVGLIAAIFLKKEVDNPMNEVA